MHLAHETDATHTERIVGTVFGIAGFVSACVGLAGSFLLDLGTGTTLFAICHALAAFGIVATMCCCRGRTAPVAAKAALWLSLAAPIVSMLSFVQFFKMAG